MLYIVCFTFHMTQNRRTGHPSRQLKTAEPEAKDLRVSPLFRALLAQGLVLSCMIHHLSPMKPNIPYDQFILLPGFMGHKKNSLEIIREKSWRYLPNRRLIWDN